jgi:HSP20 family molecular chaperone IbpA
MDSIFKKVMIPALSAFIGAAAMLVAVKLQTRKAIPVEVESEQAQTKAHTPRPHKANQIHDVWAEMDRNFKEQAQAIQARFGEASEDISQREDENFVYLDIKVDDPKSTALNTEVTEKHIIISGQIERKSASNESESFFKSSFTRSLPIPNNVDAEKMEMQSEAGKIVLRFPKLKALVGKSKSVAPLGRRFNQLSSL